MKRALLAFACLAVLSGIGAAAVAAPKPPAAPPSGFTLAAAPANLNVPTGTQGAYQVTVTRTGFTAAIAFSVTGLPTGTTGAFVPTSTTGTGTTLTVSTSPDTPHGSYNPVITGTSGSTSASVTVHLTVSAGQAKQFAIAGNLDRQLAPGVTGHVDLRLTNSDNQDLAVVGLTVTVAQTSRPACTTSNFAVGQFSGAYPLTVPANTTRALSQLGVPQSAWPTVTMTDLPTNQDACKNVTLTLGYSGSGQGS